LEAPFGGLRIQSVSKLLDLLHNQRIGLEGTIKAYAGCSRIIATIQRSSSTELPAESGEKRKKPPIFIDSKPASENREGRRMTYAVTWAEWVGHADASIRPHAA
jgi:hypothetical protein